MTYGADSTKPLTTTRTAPGPIRFLVTTLMPRYTASRCSAGKYLAVMVSGITAKYFPAEQRLAVYRGMSVVTRNLIGPGAVLVVVSGFVLSAPYVMSAVGTF